MATSAVYQATEDPTHLSMMMAWCVHEFGPPDVMTFERVLRPNPGPSDVLVKVEAAGVGPWDGWIRAEKSALPRRGSCWSRCSHRMPACETRRYAHCSRTASCTTNWSS
jgi:hypothetical protein